MRTKAKFVIPRLVAVAVLGVVVSGCCFLHLFWSQGTRPLTYFIHPSIPSAWIDHITQASVTWNGIVNLFSFGGIGGAGGYADDGVNSIFLTLFANPDWLAAVQAHGGCHLHDTDMGWSAGQVFATDGVNDHDVQTVALHEFGHYGILHHVICPGSSIMLTRYQDVRRTPSGCDAFGMWVSNALPACFPAMGICFPWWFFFALNASDSLDQENQAMVSPFAQHADELIQIWEGDTALRDASNSVGEFYANLAQDYENGHASPWEYTFTWERYNQLNAQIIEPVYASASWPLRAEIDNLRAELQSKIGQSFGQIFSGDLDNYPGNPGTPIEPDPPTECYACGGGDGGGGGCGGTMECLPQSQQ